MALPRSTILGLSLRQSTCSTSAAKVSNRARSRSTDSPKWKRADVSLCRSRCGNSEGLFHGREAGQINAKAVQPRLSAVHGSPVVLAESRPQTNLAPGKFVGGIPFAKNVNVGQTSDFRQSVAGKLATRAQGNFHG